MCWMDSQIHDPQAAEELIEKIPDVILAETFIRRGRFAASG